MAGRPDAVPGNQSGEVDREGGQCRQSENRSIRTAHEMATFILRMPKDAASSHSAPATIA